jgi:hypothetical protein
MRHGPRLSDVMIATLRPLAAFALLAWAPAFTQTICHDPPAGMSCPGDRLVWVNTPSGVYHFNGQRYFGCTKTGKFLPPAPPAPWLQIGRAHSHEKWSAAGR